MSECSRCRAPLPEDAPLGVCPACLLEGATRQEQVREEVDVGFLGESSRSEALGVFDGYEVLEVVGQGASGIVLKAEDPALRRTVAIKVLHPVLATSAVSRERFEREARAAAAVSHEHVVTIHAVGQWHGLPYLVMEFVAGKSLAERLRRDGALELKEILRIGGQIAAGMAAAHAQGLVHRDIKPGNVLLENGIERVKLTDFGLARAHDESGLTLTGFMAGTPEYMSPEQFTDENIDARSDLFSLGAVIYAMATGGPPFRGHPARILMQKIGAKGPPALALQGRNRPEWLEKLVSRLLSRNPAQRPQSAREVERWFAARLAEVQRDAAESATPRRRGWRNRRRAMLLGGIGLLALGAVLFWPPRAEMTRSSAVTYDRGLFEKMVSLARRQRPLAGTEQDRSIESLLSAGWKVVYLGRRLHDTDHQDGAPSIKDLVRSGQRAGLPEPEAAAYVVFSIDEDPREWRVNEAGFAHMLEKFSSGDWNAPPAGVWLGAVTGPEALEALPPDSRYPCFEFWALVAPGDQSRMERQGGPSVYPDPN